MKVHLGRICRAMDWANREVLDALRATPETQAEAIPLMAHIVATEQLWLARIQSQQPAHAVWPDLTLDECQALAAANAANYAAFLDGLSEAGLGSIATYRNSKGDKFSTTVIDVLTHVPIHGAYHRGQIAKLFGRHGKPGVNTDYIAFARLIEPTDA